MTNKKDKTLAGILSFLIPGLGQVYAGRAWRGVFWFIGAIIGYLLFWIPGIIVMLFSVWDAVEVVKKINKA